MQQEERIKQYLFVSDFDQTLSFNDSGLVLSELLGVSTFQERVAGLSNINLVQQGGELTYLLLHDPEFRCVRKDHLVQVGKRIRLKENIRLLSDLLRDLEGHQFEFFVVSAAPQEVIQSALEGIVPPDHIYASQLTFDDEGRVNGVACLRAGYGKVAILDMGTPVRIWELAERLIRIKGLRPGADIEIVETGLRPGEKLHEELWWHSDSTVPSSHSKIMLGDVGTIPGGARPLVAAICALVEAEEEIGLRDLLTRAVGLTNGNGGHERKGPVSGATRHAQVKGMSVGAM